jgi:TetR/AcrR family transcriptional repressor of nem operon
VDKEPRTAPGRATRERILRAATELVAEHGVGHTSMDDVLERAHASKSQMYLYFADRDALMQAVSEATCDDVIDVQAGALADFDSVEGIKRYLDTLVALQEERESRGGCPIGSLAGQLAEHNEGARLALAAGFDRWEAGLCVGLQSMADRGELCPECQPELLAKQTLAALQGGLLLTQVRRNPSEMRAAADAVLALIRAHSTAAAG